MNDLPSQMHMFIHEMTLGEGMNIAGAAGTPTTRGLPERAQDTRATVVTKEQEPLGSGNVCDYTTSRWKKERPKV